MAVSLVTNPQLPCSSLVYRRQSQRTCAHCIVNKPSLFVPLICSFCIFGVSLIRPALFCPFHNTSLPRPEDSFRGALAFQPLCSGASGAMSSAVMPWQETCDSIAQPPRCLEHPWDCQRMWALGAHPVKGCWKPPPASVPLPHCRFGES